MAGRSAAHFTREIPGALLAPLLCGLATACGGAPAPATQAPTAPAAAPVDPCARPAEPGARSLIEQVSPAAVQTIEALLNRQKPAQPGLRGILEAVYAEHPDAFDLLFVVTPDTGPVKAAGRFIRTGPVNRPQLGLVSRGDAELHPIAPRLEGVVLLRLPEGEGYRSGPALHESLHRYGQFLPTAAGFPRNGHWGYTGVGGQLGGFDPETLRCVEPAGARPPDCARDPDGRLRVEVGRFSPFANGGDRRAYAPLELYLMGLLPADEVPDPIPVLRDPEILADQSSGDTFVVATSAVDTIAMADVLAATGGPRPPADARERAPRAAFVLVTRAAPTGDVRAVVTAWARGLAGAQPDWPLHSYCSATGGRARLDTRVDRPEP